MTLAKLRDRLAAILLKRKGDERQLEIAQNRWEANHLSAVTNHRLGKQWERKAERYRKQHHPRAAWRARIAAKRAHSRAWKAHLRAQYWVGKVKEIKARIEGWELKQTVLEDLIQKELIETRATGDVPNNKVTGGTKKQRLRLAMHLSAQNAREFYSQSGTWSVEYCLTGPPWGYRYDCSSWFTSVYWTVGAPDPNGLSYRAGYTGSLGEHGKEISESQLDTGDAILFGYAPFAHVEAKDGPISESPYTVGHGSPAVDRGTVDLLPGPRSYRRYI